MRRADRQVTDVCALREIMQRCDAVTLALAGGAPYAVPVSFGYEEEDGRFSLYLHCAMEGEKLRRMQESGHSARRTFQALRIAVNDELEPLRAALEDMAELLNPGGHLAVITFHSLEDRIVKQTLRQLANPCTCPPRIPVCICGKKPVVRVLGGGGIKPGAEEIGRNPRSRSAMLRGCEKL